MGSALLDVSPPADRVEVLEREAHGIHEVVAARAGDVAAVLGQPLADREAVDETVLSFSAGTSGGGGGGGVPRMFSRIHLPRITGDVRVA